MAAPGQKPQIQPCRYKTGKTLGAGSYSVVKECVHIDTGHYYAAKVINKRMMAGREHMVGGKQHDEPGHGIRSLEPIAGQERDCRAEEGLGWP